MRLAWSIFTRSEVYKNLTADHTLIHLAAASDGGVDDDIGA